MSTRTRSMLWSTLALGLCLPAGGAQGAPLPPRTSASWSMMAGQGLVGGAAAGAEFAGLTPTPDLFAGGLTHRIPLDLPPGRGGIAPSLALVYRSGGADGWLGMGWNIDLPSIMRNTRKGLRFDGDAYDFGAPGSDLVPMGGVDYRARVEEQFRRFRKLVAADGLPYWEVVERSGVRYLFGQTAASRQSNPANATQIFKWCLDRVEDPDGNYYQVTYVRDQGQIYPDVISYTGGAGLAPSSTVQFRRSVAARPDASTSYRAGFAVTTAYLLQSIEVRANGVLQRIYAVEYTPSTSTGRPMVSALRRFGSDAAIDAAGLVTGTELPATRFGYSAGGPPSDSAVAGPAVWATGSVPNLVNADLSRLLYGDFNGDGRTDVAYVDGSGTSLPMKIFLSTGQGFAPSVNGPVRFVSTGAAAAQDDMARVKLGDFNGDGRTDILTIEGNSAPARVSIYLANRDGSFPPLPSFQGPFVTVTTIDVDVSRVMLGDFNGDGKTDVLYLPPSAAASAMTVHLSTGTGFRAGIPGPLVSVPAGSAGLAGLARVKLGDFNGDGRTEIAIVTGSGQSAPMTIWGLNAAETAVPFLMYGPSRFVRADAAGMRIDASRVMVADVNGDGLSDLLALEGWGTTAPMSVYLSAGTSFATPFAGPSRYFDHLFPDLSLGRVRLGDFNGDGRTDLAFVEGQNGSSAAMSIHLSEGSRFGAALPGPVRTVLPGSGAAQELLRVGVGDFDGDGRADLCGNNSSGTSAAMSMYLAVGPSPDLIVSTTNGIGGSTTVAYQSSSAYPNDQLPLPVQTVREITTNDGNGVVATTRYSFSGGYYHTGEREFRGFRQSVATGPAGPDGEQLETRSWFHQGDDVGADANQPAAVVGYTKGKPARVQVWDLQRSSYTETITTYWPGAAPSYFAPPSEVKVQHCELVAPGTAPTCGRSTRTTYGTFDAAGQLVYAHDAYGNALRENQHGDGVDLTGDRTVVRTYSANTAAWIVALPAAEEIYAGAGPGTRLDLGGQIAGTYFSYDGSLNPLTCASSGSSTMPTKGNPTRIVRLLKGGTNPEEWTGYDAQGNVVCTSDADRRLRSFGYDPSRTFRTSTTNAKGQIVESRYYGVGGVAEGGGRYGQLQRLVDPNGIEKRFEYDVFGRQVKEINPPVPTPLAGEPFPGLTVTTTYFLGGVGVNRTERETSAGQWEADYLDGLGRVVTSKRRGSSQAGARIFATRVSFGAAGTKRQESQPYVDVQGALPRWTTFSYDGQGRPLSITRPDGTRELTCHRDLDGSAARLDGNGHRRRQVTDARGNLVRVDEYRGSFTFCATDVGAPYATTRYEYDALARLTGIVDARGNRWATDYDTLGRRKFQSDPDLGTWYYEYSPGGDLLWQQDANGSAPNPPYKIGFQYDALHRVTLKDFPPAGPDPLDTRYAYDGDGEAAPVPYSLGSLTRMTDATGYTLFRYDAAGRNFSRTQRLDGKDYTTATGWDPAGRVSREDYPDPAAAVSAVYGYDADGFLATVTVGGTKLATLGEYNALGQLGSVAYDGTGVSTRYQYHDAGNNRVRTITTTRATSTLISLTYGYDNVRNVTSISDGTTPAYSQTYGYDELDRLTSATSTAFGALGYGYDTIGNILSKEGVSYTAYHPLKVHAVTATSSGRTFSYDSNGNLKSDGVRTFSYDYENRPSTIATGALTTSFGYDGNGQRVKKKVEPSGTTTLYLGRLLECQGAACTRHVFAGDRRIASIGPAGTRYYHGDHLDSTRLVTDQTGAVVEAVAYRPYGEGTAGTTKYRYTAKELDAETGLYYYGARYYDPTLARFTGPDPIEAEHDDPQTLNRFAYCRNNPLYFNDPTGLAENDAGQVPSAEPATPKLDPIWRPDSELRPGGYYDAFGHWHVTFCGSCHDGSPAAEHFKAQSQLANMLDWRVLAYQELMGTALTLGVGRLTSSLSTVRSLQTLSSLRSSASSARTLSLPILEASFVPDARKVLQNITTAQNARLAANPQLARTVLSSKELAAAAKNPGLMPATYGKAVERLVVRKVNESPLHSSILRPVGGPRQPDFVGAGSSQGMNFDITTPRSVPAHLARPGYGPGLNVVTYQRPAGVMLPSH